MRLAPRPPARLRAYASALAGALVLAATGCGSHHNPSSTASTTGAETAEPLVNPPTSCEEGDTACSCVDVDIADYDRACTVASDCLAVTTGRICGGSSCFAANAAINVDSYQPWNTDRQPVEYASCVPSTSGTLACVSHTCVIQYPGSGGSSSGADSGSGGAGSGGSGGSGGTGGSDNGVIGDLTSGDDDDTGTTTATAGDDDDSSGTSSGDDDDDDKSHGKRRPQANAVHARSALHSAPVTDTLK